MTGKIILEDGELPEETAEILDYINLASGLSSIPLSWSLEKYIRYKNNCRYKVKGTHYDTLRTT